MKARDYSLYLLGKRPYGTRELQLKLQKKEFSEEEIAEVIDEFIERKWLDDYEFGLILSRNQFLKKKSRRQVENSLYGKGLSREVIVEVLKATYDVEKERESLENLVRKYRKNSNTSREAIIRRLLYRGFSIDEIKRVLDEE